MAKKRTSEPLIEQGARRLIPLERAEAEIVVVNSRFIATLEPVHSPEAARAFIAEMRERYADASHNVPAYIIGFGNSTMAYCSDDGEPSGSSGRPLLTVLQGSGFGNIAIVVTRYFGGTKLGVGGLVRAYGDAGKAVLERVRPAELKSATLFSLQIPYSFYDRFGLLAAEFGAAVHDESFEGEITVRGQVMTADYDEFEAEIFNRTNGRARPERLSINPDAVFPIA